MNTLRFPMSVRDYEYLRGYRTRAQAGLLTPEACRITIYCALRGLAQDRQSDAFNAGWIDAALDAVGC